MKGMKAQEIDGPLATHSPPGMGGQRGAFHCLLSEYCEHDLFPITVIFQMKLLEFFTQMLDLSFLFSDIVTHSSFLLFQLCYLFYLGKGWWGGCKSSA